MNTKPVLGLKVLVAGESSQGKSVIAKVLHSIFTTNLGVAASVKDAQPLRLVPGQFVEQVLAQLTRDNDIRIEIETLPVQPEAPAPVDVSADQVKALQAKIDQAVKALGTVENPAEADHVCSIVYDILTKE